MKDNIFQRRVVSPILALLRQGATPEKIALSIVLGIALGVFPVLGSTTLLCALAAVALRLNLPAIQLVNYLVYPLQLALLFPFLRLGEKILRAAPLPLSSSEVLTVIHFGAARTIQILGSAMWHAIVAWCGVAPVFVALGYFALAAVLRRVWRAQIAPSRDTAEGKLG